MSPVNGENFGDWKQAVGKAITQENKRTTLVVTGVLDDISVNSHFPFQVVITYKTFQDGSLRKDDLESTIGQAIQEEDQLSRLCRLFAGGWIHRLPAIITS